MLETLLASGGMMYLPWSGPGNKTLIKGTRRLGYFGLVTDNELFGASVFYGINPGLTGNRMNTTAGWLKFILDDRILFVKRYNIMNSTSWQTLYDAGAIYGKRGPGDYANPVNGPVDQFKLFTKLEVIAGKEISWPLKLQVLKGADEYINGTNDWLSSESEWDKLIVSVTNGEFDTLSWTEMMNGVSGYNHIQDFSADMAYIGYRGYPNVNGKYNYEPSRLSSSFYWRPVLELITNPNFLLEPINIRLLPGDVPLTTSLPTFKGPDVFVKDIINFAAYNSTLHQIQVDFTTPVPTVVATVVGGGGYSLSAMLSNEDVIVPVSNIAIRNSGLLYPQVDITKSIGYVQGSNNTARSLTSALSNEGVIKPIQDIVIQRGALHYPTTRLSTVKASVSFQNNAKQTSPDVKFTQEQPQTLDTVFSNDTLNGFTL